MKAASSIISKDTASDRAESEFEDLACILDPLARWRDNLLFSIASTFNHDGKFSHMNFTLDTILRAVAWVVARASMFLSL